MAKTTRDRWSFDPFFIRKSSHHMTGLAKYNIYIMSPVHLGEDPEDMFIAYRDDLEKAIEVIEDLSQQVRSTGV